MSTTNDTTDSTDPADRTDEIAALREEVQALRRDLARAEDRIADLEEQVGPSSSLPAAASDWRDARVFEALDAGQVIGVSTFRDVVAEATDIRDSDTITERVKSLAQGPAFEQVGSQRWRFCGPDGGD